MSGAPAGLALREIAPAGFRLSAFVRKPDVTGNCAKFEAVGPRSAPAADRPRRLGVDGTVAGQDGK